MTPPACAVAPGPRILMFDVETSPNVSAHFGTRDQHIGMTQVLEVTRVICWAAKWLGESDTMFRSEYTHGREAMLQGIHDLMSEADILMTYNGISFDVPKLNWDFEMAHMGEPAPSQHIDLYRVIGARTKPLFRKLDFLLQQLGLGAKVKHDGMALWLRCRENDADAWAQMEHYNRTDVTELEGLYYRFRPWIKNHPHMGLYANDGTDVERCPNCGSTNLTRQGYHYSAGHTVKRQRYRCECGKWLTGGKPLARVTTKSI